VYVTKVIDETQEWVKLQRDYFKFFDGQRDMAIIDSKNREIMQRKDHLVRITV